MAKKDNQKTKSSFLVETPPVGLFPVGSIVRVSGNKVITKDDQEPDSSETESVDKK